MIRRRSEDGIALVEVLVAFILIALSLTVLCQVLASSTLRTRPLETFRAAELVARSQLAAAGVAYPLQARAVTGIEGPYLWTLDSQPVSEAGQSDAGVLWRVRISVRLRSGGSAVVRLRSMRLVRA